MKMKKIKLTEFVRNMTAVLERLKNLPENAELNVPIENLDECNDVYVVNVLEGVGKLELTSSCAYICHKD